MSVESPIVSGIAVTDLGLGQLRRSVNGGRIGGNTDLRVKNVG